MTSRTFISARHTPHYWEAGPADGHNLRPLEREGLMVLVVDPDDKRSRLAKLTEKGENKLRETAALWQSAQDRFESKFGVEKAKALREVLAIVAGQDF